MNRLAKCVAVAETGYCMKGSGVSHKNCFGIMEYSTGKRRLKHYSNVGESFDDFKRIWNDYYGALPSKALAAKWTGNDNPEIWLNNFYSCYNEPN